MIFNAILPIFLLIFFGYFLKKLSIVHDSFWADAEQLTYYVFFPALLISKMSVTELAGVNIAAIFSISLISIFVITILNYGLRKIFKISDFSFGAFYQGTVRFNTYIGLALVSNLFDENGIAIAIIIAAVLIPTVNICSVTVLQIHQQKTPQETNKNFAQHLLNNVYNLIKNPLILGCLIGYAINFFTIQVPAALFEVMQILGALALPFGLMTVGAALILRNIQQELFPIILSSTLKLIAMPLLGFWLAHFFQLESITTQILVIFFALPCATASYILTKKMGSDYQFMARLIALETLFSSATLLFTLHLLNIH